MLNVAEAKRQFFGRVGIDPLCRSDGGVDLADDSADAEMVAVDLLGQAEHGLNGPALLMTTSRQLAEQLPQETGRQFAKLPTAEITGKA